MSEKLQVNYWIMNWQLLTCNLGLIIKSVFQIEN